MDIPRGHRQETEVLLPHPREVKTRGRFGGCRCCCGGEVGHRRVRKGRAEAVRRVDELRRVGETHWLKLRALQVLAAECVGVGASDEAVGAWLVADALDEDQPALRWGGGWWLVGGSSRGWRVEAVEVGG